MFDVGNNRLEVFKCEVEQTLIQLISAGAQFYALRTKTREIALEYPELIVWSPELRADRAVIDIWDRTWKRVGSVSIVVTQEMQNAPVW